VVLAAVIGAVVWLVTGGSSSSGPLPSFTISVSQGSAASPDSIIESEPSLAGVLVGSSEDYELLGYLALEHLTGKVKVVPFADENTAGAAAVSGAINAAY
jgi:hypothetical protein